MSSYRSSRSTTKLRHISTDDLEQSCSIDASNIPLGSAVPLSHVSPAVTAESHQPTSSSDICTVFPTPPNSQTSSSSESAAQANIDNALSYPPPLIRHQSTEGYQQAGDIEQEQPSLETTTRLYHVDPPPAGPGPPQLIKIVSPACIQLKSDPEGATRTLWHATPNLNHVPWPLPPNAANKVAGEEGGVPVSGTGLSTSGESHRYY